MKNYKLNKLRKAVLNQQKKQLKDSIEMINDLQTVEEIKNDWRAKQYLTPFSKKKDWDSPKDLKNYLIDRIKKAKQKEFDKEIQHFETVLNSGELIEATITVEWKDNRTWGSNPRAHIKGSYKNDFGTTHYFSFESESIGGCGYDKHSTAVAQVVNQVNPILRSFYIKKNRTPQAKNGEILGYGSGYRILPALEGGVGVSCYPRIFEAIGYKFETVASGKKFDVHTIKKG